jgi:hypothetical protein
MRVNARVAAGFVLLSLLAAVIFIFVYFWESMPPKVVIESTPASRPALPMPLTNTTDAAEADDIFASICANYPGAVAHARKADLVRFHSSIQMKRNGPGGEGPMPGAYSRVVQWCHPGGGIGLWGIYERWGAGRYVAVYRIRPLDGWDGNESCTLEIQSNAGSTQIAAYVPKPTELKPGQWVDVPVTFTLPQRIQIEFRFWAGANGFAVDRIYLFRLS